jgi:predicted CXXCH cytochrome family protein
MTQVTIPPGPSDLTEDLSDDHPIGFRFDRALAARDRQLVNPDVVTDNLPLGRHGEVHCTTCHDPHDNALGNFLRQPDRMSAICVSCHQMDGWLASSHARSSAPVFGRTVDPRELMPHGTVAENGCTGCHKIHSAPQPERLLRFRREEDNCLNCHSGGVAVKNVESEFRKRSVHPIELSSTRHDADEESRSLRRRHVECADCHNPHAVAPSVLELATGTGVGLVGPTMRFVSGVDRSGNDIKSARFEYEVCLKCHGDTAPRTQPDDIPREITQKNTRLEFQTNNPSFHPVFGARNSRDSVSLIAPLRPGSIIKCTDSSDSPGGPGSTAAAGPHGSNFAPLLKANYETRAFTIESAEAYALCYQCHSRDSILGNESFPGHRRHIVDGRTPCSACHDAHGISRTQGDERSHGHLINFDRSLVMPAGQTSSRIEFLDLGLRQGSCTLTCHSVVHVDFRYGDP